MKHTKRYVTLLLAFFLAGCNGSVQPSKLEGSWHWSGGGAEVTWTYLKDSTWVMAVAGATNAVLTGGWILDGNRLITTTKTSTLTDTPPANPETVKIKKLDDLALVVDSRDPNGNTRLITLRRVDRSDTEFAKKLVGSWILWATNAAAGTLISGTSIYNENGTVLWDVAIRTQSRTQAVSLQGVWRVESGILSTTPTNATASAMQLNKESRDEIMSLTDSQLIYRDRNGKIHLNMKRE